MTDTNAIIARWFAELRRRKVVRVAIVYIVIAWLLIQVADATFEPIGLPTWAHRLVIVLAMLGFPLACGLAWAFDVTPRGIERTPAPDARSRGTPGTLDHRSAPRVPRVLRAYLRSQSRGVYSGLRSIGFGAPRQRP